MFLLKLVKNKFFLLTIAFVIWVFFFAQYDLLSLYKQKKELNEMNAKIEYLEKEVEWLKKEKEAIQKDSAVMERYAREKYFMKTPYEEVYVFDTLITRPSNNH